MISVINPWHDTARQGSRSRLTYEGKPLLTHRGVEVYKNPAGSWDYVFAGMAITQRAGFDAQRAYPIIDFLLSGEDLTLSDYVRRHIAAFLPRCPGVIPGAGRQLVLGADDLPCAAAAREGGLATLPAWLDEEAEGDHWQTEPGEIPEGRETNRRGEP